MMSLFLAFYLFLVLFVSFFNLEFMSLLLLFVFFFFFFNCSYMGYFLIVFDNVFLVLCYMSFLILLIIYLSESSYVLTFFSFFLVLFSIFFFFAGNFFLLYIFFELSMFPILLMILGFGSQIEKINSGYYLLFYSSFCSLPFLILIFCLDMLDLNIFFYYIFSWEFYFISLLLFLMKFPLFFLHLWLPKAHVEAPTSASMLLAGLLLKLGTGGFIRVFFILKFNFEYFLYLISFVGFFLSGFMCLFQSDLKSFSAYSSVNHMMFLLFIFVSYSIYGKWGSVSIMLLHGFISTLMFYFVGEFYHSSFSRMIYFFGGFMKVSLYFLIIFILVWLFNGGVPPSLSFFSEYMGLGVIFNMNKFIFFGLFFYFFVSFYYTMYVIVNSYVGKNILNVLFWNSFYSYFMLIWSVNFFFFNFFL